MLHECDSGCFCMCGDSFDSHKLSPNHGFQCDELFRKEIGDLACGREGPNSLYREVVGRCRLPEAHDGKCIFV